MSLTICSQQKRKRNREDISQHQPPRKSPRLQEIRYLNKQRVKQAKEVSGPKEVSLNPLLRMLRNLSTGDTVLSPLSPHANPHAVPSSQKACPNKRCCR